MNHKTIHSERGTVHYWCNDISINRKTLIFSHGLTANHTMFEKQVEFFAEGYNVIAWDIPLHGESRPYTGFSYANCARDLCSILDAEHIDKTVLVGMSMGGYPSQMFAHMYPKRTLGLVAIDTTPFGLEYYSKSDIWVLCRVGTMAGWFPDKMLRNSMAKSVSTTGYSRDIMLTMLAPLTKAQIVEQMDIAYGRFIEENTAMELSCPLLILLGDHDKTGNVRKYCQAWSHNTGYPLIIIKDAAHFSNGDNPAQVNAEIEKFVLGL